MGPGRGPMGRGGPRAMMRGEKAKNFKATMKQLMGYLKDHLPTFIAVWIIALISTAFMILGPRIMGMITDELAAGFLRQAAGTGGIDFVRIGRIILICAGLYAFSAFCQYIQGYVMSGVSNKISYKLRDDINLKIHRLPFRFFDGTTHGEVLSRITNDVDTVNQTLNQGLTQIISSIASVIGIVIMMFTISWQLTLVALCVIPLFFLSIAWIIRSSQGYFKDQQRYLGNVNGHIEEMFSSHTVVKAFSGEADSIRTFDEYNNALYHSAWRANFLSGLLMPINMLISNIAYVIIVILGSLLAVRGGISIGGIQAFIQYVHSFNQPITQIANISNILQQTAAAAERVFEFLAEEEEIPDSIQPVSVEGSRGQVWFDHVAFGYNPETLVIRDLDALIEPGQKIAIVGPTGAGKTTIVKLLMRFYDVSSGAIRIDGKDIRSFKRDELRSLFGMVLQDTWLFSGTIADNIRYGKPGASDEDVEEAARAAQVDHFVHTWPDGYKMVLNEETANISQGQKQLLTIARAVLANPKILILDEATSSVDTRTELLIQKAMDNLMTGRTSFVIAHRLSTIRNADLILVIRDGDIVEQGTHSDLINRSGFYAELYNSQFEAGE
ncbi:ABC-type multidrug/protein/lipid transport system, ATPase component [Treponema primitia ZAS-2]|uniref:ABC-type multidrug/protein/lipid transport system, ATPase component n=2 Tax=Treponema primitia TaxID=88058 RepID=F5YQR2_TREPZ|nr:ABC-type multidrug/protein/lipid transport system, ATPase component [Treponema primitia ZAS-2]